MAKQPPANYAWELGIDWDLDVVFLNASYLPGGFLLEDTDPAIIKRPFVHSLDTIKFRIFDVTHGPRVTSIESFTINPQPAVTSQGQIDPLEHLQPLVTQIDPRPSGYFSGGPFNCWESPALQVTLPEPDVDKKFLLNFVVQAKNGDTLRTFVHDPEMIVGPNGG